MHDVECSEKKEHSETMTYLAPLAHLASGERDTDIVMYEVECNEKKEHSETMTYLVPLKHLTSGAVGYFK
jgi:hypothetical protein